jgi:predicted GH43/DUF377 family glycosyl hydrolase
VETHTGTRSVARSITTPPPVRADRLFGGAPILQPNPANSWESRVVLNPAACLVEAGPHLDALLAAWQLPEPSERKLREAGGACVLVYRAQGEVEPEKDAAPSYLGLAVFTPLLELVHRWDQPTLRPQEAFHNLGLEDARCTRIGERYFLHYTSYAELSPEDDVPNRIVRICLAKTQDFLQWELLGPVHGDVNIVDNKNAALLPEPVEGRWILLHRPMSGPDAMTIHWATASVPEGPWEDQGMLMPGYDYAEFARSWIGAGGPPIALGDGRFLAIYHQGHYASDGTREYDLAAALLDFRREDPVVARIEPLMRPTGAAEQVGDAELGVDNVLFVCGGYRWGEHLVLPYAAADSRIFGATLPFEDLVRALEESASGDAEDHAEGEEPSQMRRNGTGASTRP